MGGADSQIGPMTSFETKALQDERRSAGIPSLTLPRRTGGDRWSVVAAFAVIGVTVGLPVVSMLLRHQRSFDLLFIWREFDVYILGSLFSAVLAGVVATVVAAGGLQQRPKFTTVLAVGSFLVGGQLLAIALIRLYNRQHLGWVYNAPPIVVMAYLGRFGWLALLAAGATWSRPWRLLRQQAELDGAGSASIAGRIVWPLAWPLVAAAGLLVLVLSLTEVPATVLITPMRPWPQIVPMLMTWVHTLESDPMIEASLLLAGVATVLAIAGMLLLKITYWTGNVRSEGDVV